MQRERSGNAGRSGDGQSLQRGQTDDARDAAEETPLIDSTRTPVRYQGTFSPGISRQTSIRSGFAGHGQGNGGLGGYSFSSIFDVMGIGTAKARQSNSPERPEPPHSFSMYEDRYASATIMANRIRYLTYYIPFLKWIQQYKWSYFQGDMVAALSIASFYLPMSLSYAANLAHVPPISGLYAFVFNPLVYALLGSSQQMVLGPEAPGCLLVGSVVKASVDNGKGNDYDDKLQGQIAGVVTGMAGAAIFVAGLTRLGFLDSVLSRPFLRGFISAIGFLILVDQLLQELGLEKVAAAAGISHGSSVDKLRFLFNNVGKAHVVTCAVAGVSFTIIMISRQVLHLISRHV